MPLNCPQAVSKLKAYQKTHQDLKKQFSDFMSQFPYLPDIKTDEPFMQSPHYQTLTDSPKEVFHNLYDTKQEVRKQLAELKEIVGYIDLRTFVVKDAVNPYAEGLKAGGITDPELVAEKKDLKINLQKFLTQDKEAYKQAGLTEWINDLPDNIRDFKLTQQQLKNLKSRIEQGEIPIFMPGRLAQLKGLFEMTHKLKPLWIEDGKKQIVKDNGYWDYVNQLIIIMIQIAELIKNNESLSTKDIVILKKQLNPLVQDKKNALNLLEDTVRNIPESSYIFTTKPAQSNDVRTKKEVWYGPLKAKDLMKRLELIKGLNPELFVDCLSIGEYLALQNRFTNRLEEEMINSTAVMKVIPLDYNEGHFAERSSDFVNLPINVNGHVLTGVWISEDAKLSIHYVGGSDFYGFRTAVRI